MAVALGLLVCWAAGIETRLVYLQVVSYTDLASRADRQQSHKIDTPAKRGDIVDRRGRILAYSVDAETIYADPSEIKDVERTAAAVCGALPDCDAKERQSIAERMRFKGKYFAY